eukprot:gene9413-10399_t
MYPRREEFGKGRKDSVESDDDIHDEGLRGVRSFFILNSKRLRQDKKELSKKDIDSIINSEARNFFEGRKIGDGLDRLKWLKAENDRTNGTTDHKNKSAYGKNESSIKILGCLRKLQKYEEEISEDERGGEFEFETRATPTIERPDMMMPSSTKNKRRVRQAQRKCLR